MRAEAAAEEVDAAAPTTVQHPRRLCCDCQLLLGVEKFSKRQWKKLEPTCKVCVADQAASQQYEDEFEMNQRAIAAFVHADAVLSGGVAFGGMSRGQYAMRYPHCAQIGYYGDPDNWDIAAGCSSD